MTDMNSAGKESLNLRALLAGAARSAVNLRVVTIVAEPTISGSIESPDVTIGGVGAAAVTNINLLEGDILTCISPSLATGELAEIKAIHEGMVAKAEGIVERNVRMLKDLVDAGFDTIAGVSQRRAKDTSIGS